MGACLGVTFNGKKAFIGPHTRECEHLVRLINNLVRKYNSDPTFTGPSIQVNKNTVSKDHVDSDNLGKSVVLMLGDFQGASSCPKVPGSILMRLA